MNSSGRESLPLSARFVSAKEAFLKNQDSAEVRELMGAARDEDRGMATLLAFLETNYSIIRMPLRHRLLGHLYFESQQMLQAQYELRKFLQHPGCESSGEILAAKLSCLAVALNRRDLRACKSWIRSIEEVEMDSQDHAQLEVLLNWYALCVHFFQRSEPAAQAGMLANISRIEALDPTLEYLDSSSTVVFLK